MRSSALIKLCSSVIDSSAQLQQWKSWVWLKGGGGAPKEALCSGWLFLTDCALLPWPPCLGRAQSVHSCGSQRGLKQRECNWFSSQAEKVYLKIALLLTNYLWGPGEVTLLQSDQQKSSVFSCISAELTLSQWRCFAVQISSSPGTEVEKVWNFFWISNFQSFPTIPLLGAVESAHSSSSSGLEHVSLEWGIRGCACTSMKKKRWFR